MYWYHIKATDINMDRKITFWLWGESESDIKNKVNIKGCYKDIQWIKKLSHKNKIKMINESLYHRCMSFGLIKHGRQA